jgi:hypothetical protein
MGIFPVHGLNESAGTTSAKEQVATLVRRCSHCLINAPGNEVEAELDRYARDSLRDDTHNVIGQATETWLRIRLDRGEHE